MYNLNKIENVLSKYEGEMELELRFKPYHKLDKKDFYSMRSKLNKIDKKYKEVKLDITYYKDNYREVNGKKELKLTESIDKEDENGFRLVLARETKVDKITTKKEKSKTKIRYKYKYKKGEFHLSISDGEEVELEYEFSEKPTVDEVVNMINEGFKIITGSSIHYSKDVFDKVVQDFNSIIGYKNKENKIYHYSIVQVVNLKYFHLDNLIDNYVCAAKADGHRYIMYCDGNTTFLIYPEYLIRVIETKKRQPFLIDGELLKYEDRKEYLISDVIMYNNIVVKDKDLLKRRKYFQDFNEDIGGISVRSKPFTKITSMNEFFIINKESMASIDKNDGLIFTPINRPYLNNKKGTDTQWLVYKWKPEDKLTMDLIYRDNNLYTKEDVSVFDLLKLKRKEIKIDDIPEGVIGEYLFKDNRFEIKKIRYKKVFPNKSDVVKDIYYDSIKPIDYKSMIGEGNKLFPKYHNILKRSLINKSSKQLEGEIICLDIGSGALGDLGKWKKYSKVICIEPNMKNITRGMERLSEEDKKRIHILPLMGQETDEIYNKVKELTKGKMCNVISLMLSLTFFDLYNDDSIINTIVRCAAEKCNVVVFTIDGMAFKYNFNKNIFFNDVTIEPKSETTVLINIGGSIVDNQLEFYVDVGLFINMLKNKGFNLEYYNHADGGFMSRNEKEFSKLFVSIIMNKNYNINKNDNKMKQSEGKVKKYSVEEIIDETNVDKHQYLLKDTGITTNVFKSDIKNDIARIITSDKNNILCCFLNTNNLSFQNNVSERNNKIKELKSELVNTILFKNNRGERNYNGILAEKFLNSIDSDEVFNISRIKKDLNGNLNNNDPDYLRYIFSVIECNCFIVRIGSGKKLILSNSLSYYDPRNNKSVFLYKIDNHYDIVGVRNEDTNKFKVLFSLNDTIMDRIDLNKIKEYLSVKEEVIEYMTKKYEDEEKNIAVATYELYIGNRSINVKNVKRKIDEEDEEKLTTELLEDIQSTFKELTSNIKTNIEESNPILKFIKN